MTANRLALGCVAIAAAALIEVAAAQPARPNPVSVATRPADVTVGERLDQPIRVNFKQSELRDVLDYLKFTLPAAIVVDWPSLRNVGVEPALPITLELEQEIPAFQVLELVLQQAGADAGQPIEFEIIGQIIHVSTPGGLRSWAVTHAHPCRDLVDQGLATTHQDLDQAAELIRKACGSAASRQPADAAAPANPGECLVAVAEYLDRKRVERMEKLAQLVMASVGRQEDWQEFGGTIGFVEVVGDQLVVRHRPSVQHDVAELLHRLRQAGERVERNGKR